MTDFIAQFSAKDVVFDAQGLVACVVQSADGDVRMVGYMNAESLGLTLQTGRVTFFSRSRQKLWLKGESSGHFLHLRELRLDCDRDALLAIADCEGPTCHRLTTSCFSIEPVADSGAPTEAHAIPRHSFESLQFLGTLEELLHARKASANPTGSYTEKLLHQGTDRIAKKVVEEAGEVILGAKNLEHENTPHNRELLTGEAADLLFHLELLLIHHDISLADVVNVLADRHRVRAAPVSKVADTNGDA